MRRRDDPTLRPTAIVFDSVPQTRRRGAVSRQPDEIADVPVTDSSTYPAPEARVRVYRPTPPEKVEGRARVRDAAIVVAEARRTGRPPVYHESFCESAYRYALLGATVEQMADAFFVDHQTLKNWMGDQPEFFAAVTRGRQEADARVAHSLFRSACGYEREAVKIFMASDDTPVYAVYQEHYPPNPSAAKNWLANRDPARWGSSTQHGTVNLTNLMLSVPREALDDYLSRAVQSGKLSEDRLRQLLPGKTIDNEEDETTRTPAELSDAAD